MSSRRNIPRRGTGRRRSCLWTEQTDAEALARLYDGLAQALPTKDPEAIALRLQALLSETALRQTDDPAHTFLMGIAYLSGVDMEVNHARAAELITEAAEAGLPEALEKLVSMYKTGEGVERNYHTAVDWQRRLADRYGETAEHDPSEKNWTAYFWALCDLGDDLLAVGNPMEAEKPYQKARRCAEIMQEHNHPKARRDLSISYHKLGDVSQDLGRPSEALEWYRQGLAIDEALAAETGTVKARRDLSTSYFNLGEVSKNLGHQKEALEWYRKGLAIDEALAAEAGTVQARRDLSFSYHKLGDVSQDLGRPSEALEWYQKGLAIAEALAAETGTIGAMDDLGVSCYKLSKLEQLPRAEREDYLKRLLQIGQQLLQKTGRQRYQQFIAAANKLLASL